MNEELKEKIKVISQNIDDIEECIECSNYSLMNDYIQLFLMNYSGSLLGIIEMCHSDLEKNYWTGVTTEILEIVKSGDVFRILDKLCFEVKEKLLEL